MALGATIEARIRDWSGDVELAIFGTREPDAVAAAVDAFCRQHLGSAIARYLFYHSSIASVHGVELTDGRQLVVKAHQPRVAEPHLRAVFDVQRHVCDVGGPAPRPLLGPSPLGKGLATVEEERTGGTWHDGHEPAFRRAIASSLAELIETCRGLDARDLSLDVYVSRLPTLWPEPHSTLFDFERTTEGAERIDELAAAARDILDAVELREPVIGHVDWRAENLRFDGTRIVAVYDWESLVQSAEPLVVGGAAFPFPSDWHRPPSGTQCASPDEARSFVADYEAAAAGTRFDAEARRLMGAAASYLVAYSARCGHARDPRGEERDTGGFRSLVDEHGTSLLRMFE